MKHYDVYRDLYSQPVDLDTVAGAQPAPGWLLLHVIPKPTEHQSAGGIIMTQQATKTSTPVVYRVIAVGEGVNYLPDDLILISFLAGDRLSGEICLAHKDDVVMKWGHGLKK